MRHKGRIESESGLIKGKGSGKERTARVNLGLTLLQLRAKPGIPLSREDIAAWAGISPHAIKDIEIRALRKCQIPLKQILHEHLH